MAFPTRSHLRLLNRLIAVVAVVLVLSGGPVSAGTTLPLTLPAPAESPDAPAEDADEELLTAAPGGRRAAAASPTWVARSPVAAPPPRSPRPLVPSPRPAAPSGIGSGIRLRC